MPLSRALRLASAIALFLSALQLHSTPLAGRVIDSEGKPVGGAAVSWSTVRSPERELLEGTKGIEPASLGQVTTDSDGRFRISMPKPESVFVRVLSPGLPSVELEGPFDLSEENEELDIPVPAAQKISGRVIDEAGKPIEGARVRIQGEADAEDSLAFAETKSGSNGAFSFDAAPENANSLKAFRPGFAPGELTGRQAKDFATVVLRRGGGAEGRVLDPAGKPVPHSIVVANDVLAVESDEAGHYEFAALLEGSANIHVISKENLLARRDGLRIRKGVIAKADLRLAPSAGIAGVVLDEKTRRPIAGARVSASRPSPFVPTVKPAGSARTDSRGRFRILGLVTTDYTVAASRSNYIRAAVSGVVAGVSRPGPVSIALRKAGTLSGKVTAESGAPVSGARVKIAPGMSWRAMMARGSGPPARTVFTSADGTFRMRGVLPAPDVAIEASREGYVPARRTGLPVRSGETTGGLTLVLRRGVEAKGRVVDAQGNPVAGAEIRLARVEVSASRGWVMDTKWDDLRPAARSGPDGRFTAANLDAGQFTARVTRAGYATKTLGSLEAKKNGVNEWAPFILQPSAVIAGVIRNTKREPVPGASVDAFTGGVYAKELTDSEGGFRFDVFQAGQSIFLNVRADGYAGTRQSVTPPSENIAIALTTAATVKGRVEDADSRQALETFHVDWHTPRSASLGTGGPNPEFHAADGSFELPGVRPGKVEVEATAEGYLPGLSEMDLAEGETKENVVLDLRKGRTVSGRVLDPVKATGVANATVNWKTPDSADDRWIMSTEAGSYAYVPNATTTDSDGKFAFTGLPASRLNFTASHPDFLEASRIIDTGNETTVDITLSAGGSIAGTVVDAGGHAASGAAVSLSVVGGAPSMSSGDDTTADASGAFGFSHLKEGRYNLIARSTGGQSPKREVSLGADQSQTGVQLEIASGTLVRGQITGLPPAQLGGMRVSATSSQPGIGSQDAFFVQTSSDEQGQFLIQNAPAGTLRLGATISWPGRSASKSVEIPAGAEEFPVEIAFTGTSRLSGRVTRHDVGVSGLHSLAEPDPPSSGSIHGYSITNGDGQYTFDGLTDGSYQLAFSGEGVEVARSVTVSGDTTFDVPLPGTTISGTVTESSSANPLDGVTIMADNGKNQSDYDAKRAVSDSAGRYTLTDLDPDNYQITARKDGYASKTQPASVGDSSTTMDFALAKANGLTIHAFDAVTGQPLAGVDALVVSATGATVFSGTVPLDSTGRGEIASLSPGSYQAHVFSAGYAPRTLTADASGPPLEVAMSTGGRVEIRTDTPASGRITDVSGGLYISSRWQMDGVVNITAPTTTWENFAPGSYTLNVPKSSGEQNYSFSVTDAKTTIIDLR